MERGKERFSEKPLDFFHSGKLRLLVEKSG
jgi:hypothetical protein